MHLCSDPLFTGSPDTATVILNDLSHNGQTDTASALGRISGRVGAVEPVKDIWQIFGCNSFSIVLDLHLDKGALIGPWSPESAGDYASGTNHTLPTGGWARAYSGVNTDSFLRKITYQELSRKGLAALSPTVIAMAEAEGLGAHAAAVRVRMKGGVL